MAVTLENDENISFGRCGCTSDLEEDQSEKNRTGILPRAPDS